MKKGEGGGISLNTKNYSNIGLEHLLKNKGNRLFKKRRSD